jgi:WD repeat-containing protein 23
MFRFTHDDFDDDEEEDGNFDPRWRRRRRQRPDPNRFPKVPSAEGAELMNSGVFGSNEAHTVTSNERNSIGKKKKLALRILDRELAVESPARQRLNQRLMAQVRLACGTFAESNYVDTDLGNDACFECRHDYSL